MFNLFKKKDPEPVPETPKKEQWMMYNIHVHGLDHKNKNGDNIEIEDRPIFVDVNIYHKVDNE